MMHQASLVEELAPFTPRFIRRRLALAPRPLGEPLIERWQGAAMVADVSGFTALAERLAEEGDVGAERLTEILNEYFGRAITRIEAHGGDVARFAGDALLVVWPCESEQELPQAARDAAACALDLQTLPDDDFSRSEAALTMKIAIGAGSLAVLHIGGFLGRWEFLISGNAFQQAFAALRQTQSGMSNVSLQAWKFLQRDFRATPLSAGVMMLDDGPRTAQAGSLAAEPTEAMSEALRSYLPAAVIDRLSAGQERWLGELRMVTTLFVSLPELNYATPLDRAQAVMQYLQRELYRYEGAVNKLNVDEKGTALLAAFGLPPLAHEDDARRGVAAALALQSRLRELGFDVSTGVATGRVYCGVFGGERRREYTLLGDTVNRAARLMQAAVGDILVDDATRQAAERSFRFESLPYVALKGKSAPLAVFRPVAAHNSASARSVELVGRAAELGILDAQLSTVIATRAARTVLVEGEPGVGKSRLLAAWMDQKQQQVAACFQGAADALETATLYFAWRHVFESLFGVNASTPPDEARRRIDLHLRDLGELADWSPLLRVVLPVDLPDNELTKHMSGRVRGENTRRLLVELLASAARRGTTIVALDDIHWLDSASWSLLEMASHVPGPLLLVLGTRPLQTSQPEPFNDLLSSANCSRVVLAPLSPVDAQCLVCRQLGVASLPRRVADFIQRRAEGNPLFTEELAFALRDAGQVVIAEGKCRLAEGLLDLEKLDFPETLHGVVTSRLDRLAPAEQLAVKVASVIGRHFAYQALHAVYPLGADRPRLRDHLGAALRTQLVEVEVPEPELTYLFRHVIAHEAAYNLLLFHQRQELHRAVAEWRESLQAEIPPPAFATMAHHWRCANEPARAVPYLDKAGQFALESGAYQEAIGFFQEALALGEHLQPQATNQQRATWERRLGEAYLGLGRLSESREHLLTSLALYGQPAPESHLGRIAGIAWNLARHWNPRRGKPAPAGTRHDVWIETSRAYEALAEIYYLSNERAPLVHALVSNLDYAQRAGPSPELARAYANNCISAGLAGLHGLARRYAQRAHEIGRAVNDPAALAWVLEVTSLYALGAGNAADVQNDLEEAIAICRRLGDWRRWGENMATLGQGAYYCGRLDLGYNTWSELRHAAEARGDELQQAWGLNGSAEGLLRKGGAGAAEAAVQLLNESHARYERNTDRISQLGAWGLLAWASARCGNPDGAWKALLAGLELSAEIGAPTGHYPLAGYANLVRTSLWLWEHGPAAEARTRAQLAAQAQHALRRYARTFPIGRPSAALWQGTAFWLGGRFDRAVRQWLKAISLARVQRMPYEEALAHRELALRLPDDDPRRLEHERAAQELADQLQAEF